MTDELGDGVSGILAAGIASSDLVFSSVTTLEAPETYALYGASKG